MPNQTLVPGSYFAVHELSIAQALVKLTLQHVRSSESASGRPVVQVAVQVGPLQGIDEPAMQLAWQAATQQSPLQGATLKLEFLPWRLQCPVCQRQWTADSWLVECTCGYTRPVPQGGDELILLSFDLAESTAESQQQQRTMGEES